MAKIYVLFLATLAIMARAKDFSFYQSRGSHVTGKVTYGDRAAWYPKDMDGMTANGTKLGVYIFVVGTNLAPTNYAATLEHVASHGFIAIGIGNALVATCTDTDAERAVDELKDDSKLPTVLQGKVDAANIVLGGHSGGGPCALGAASKRGSVVRGVIAQHSAAIPAVNRLSDATIKALPGAAMTLCGTVDIMPFCGCLNAQNDFYGRFEKSLPRVGIAIAGAGHNDGTEGKSGDGFEGGFIVAFLHTILNKDTQAGHDLITGVATKKDSEQNGAWPPAAQRVIV